MLWGYVPSITNLPFFFLLASFGGASRAYCVVEMDPELYGISIGRSCLLVRSPSFLSAFSYLIAYCWRRNKLIKGTVDEKTVTVRGSLHLLRLMMDQSALLACSTQVIGLNTVVAFPPLSSLTTEVSLFTTKGT